MSEDSLPGMGKPKYKKEDFELLKFDGDQLDMRHKSGLFKHTDEFGIEKTCWLPNSKTKWIQPPRTPQATVTIEIPRWLAREKGLI